jgi:hypothetical protein
MRELKSISHFVQQACWHNRQHGSPTYRRNQSVDQLLENIIAAVETRRAS